MRMSATAAAPRPKRLPKANILVIDDDLGFVFFFGRLLAQAGYQPWPAQHFREAAHLIRKRRIKVHLVVGSERLNIKPFLASLTIGGGQPKLIALEEPYAAQELERNPASVEAVIKKPAPDEELPVETWLETVRWVLEKKSFNG